MYNIKKEVKKKIDQYSNKEYLDGYIKSEYLTADGDADIFLNINNIEEFYDEKTLANQLDLNSEVYEYIDSKTEMLDNSVKINLQVVSPELSSNESQKIKHLISEHYAIELYKVQREYKKYNSKIVKLLALGFIFFVCYLLINMDQTSTLFSEVFGFLFSFLLWEAFDTIIYTLSEIKAERESVTQKLLMEITFRNK